MMPLSLNGHNERRAQAPAVRTVKVASQSAQALATLMRLDRLHTMDKTSVSAMLWLYDDPKRMATLREIRDTMTVGERARLNSPISVRQRVEKISRRRDKRRP
jgi:hypothetical protein